MNRLETLLEKTYFSDKFDLTGIDDLPLSDDDYKFHRVGYFVFYKIRSTDWHVLPFDISKYSDKDTLFCVRMMCRGLAVDIIHNANGEKPLHEIIHLNIPEAFALENDFLEGNLSVQLLLQNLNIRRKNELQ